jgi:aspartate aminotransferase-like enzyme
VDPRALLRLAQPQIHHRSPEARALISSVRAKLQRLFAGAEVLLTTSSGTGAFEAALTSLVPREAPVLSASAGKFGARWGQMAERLGYRVERLEAPWGQALDPGQVAAAVSGKAALLLTHSETSTGVLHDVEAIAAAARATEPDLLILVDAVTSFAVAPLLPLAWGLDAVIAGSQKGAAIPPGLGFVALSPAAAERLLEAQGFSLNLARELRSQRLGETAYTPAINLIAALDYSLDRLLSLDLEVLWGERARMSRALLEAGVALGCRPFAERPSPAVATLCPPPGWAATEVTRSLQALGARAAAGQDAYKDLTFRISLMGYFDRYDALAVAGLLEEALAALGCPFERGAAVRAAWEALGT